jgi:hypothetical protein
MREMKSVLRAAGVPLHVVDVHEHPHHGNPQVACGVRLAPLRTL